MEVESGTVAAACGGQARFWGRCSSVPVTVSFFHDFWVTLSPRSVSSGGRLSLGLGCFTTRCSCQPAYKDSDVARNQATNGWRWKGHGQDVIARPPHAQPSGPFNVLRQGEVTAGSSPVRPAWRLSVLLLIRPDGGQDKHNKTENSGVGGLQHAQMERVDFSLFLELFSLSGNQ